VSINDWHDDRAHRADLNPLRDWENDDVIDPFEFGATEDRTRWVGASRATRAARNLSAPWTPVSEGIRHTRPDRGEHSAAVEQLLVQLLVDKPHLSLSACQRAVELRGLPTRLGDRLVLPDRKRTIRLGALRPRAGSGPPPAVARYTGGSPSPPARLSRC
jgi:hypothetical protein